MIEVFPTPWSPKKTNLYLARGAKLGPPFVGVVVLSFAAMTGDVYGSEVEGERESGVKAVLQSPNKQTLVVGGEAV
jgi:hypothetical protein